MALEYRLESECKDTEARLGRVQTFHGEFETPIFMPVGTQAVVKALTERGPGRRCADHSR